MSQVGMEWAQGTESVWYGIDAFTALHGNTSVLNPLWTKFVK